MLMGIKYGAIPLKTSLIGPPKFKHKVNLCCAVLSHSVMSDSCDHMDYSLPGSSVHGDSLGKNTGLGCHALLQRNFPTQESNQGFLHCRQVLYHLSYRESPELSYEPAIPS